MSSNVLLLLVHLHILNYPYANNTEYDHHLFNSRVRGLRERTKALEDIAYFLVRQIEGESSKILQIYPCRQPSESLAFRTSLTKYLEQLRHQSIYPSRASSLAAPWWRDVVVRKSLLEESTGDKFDRLMLALSTHALMKASYTIPQEVMNARLLSEPVSYANALVGCQSVRQSWIRLASSLLERQRDLRSLRVKFQGLLAQSPSKYEGLSTTHLKALALSKYQDLMNSCAEEMRAILASFIDLSGVCNPFGIAPLKYAVAAQRPSLSPRPLPLPIAAAHHPSSLKKFKHTIVRNSKSNVGPSLSGKTYAGEVLATHIEAENRIQQLLASALSRHDELKKAIASNIPQPSSKHVSTFLQPLPTTFDITYDPKPVKELLNSLDLRQDLNALEVDSEFDHELEHQVAEIRTSILPPFPTLCDELSAPRLQNTPTEPTLLPKTRVVVMRSPDSSVPQLPKQSPELKSIRGTRRKSVRFSTARRRLTKRPSIFNAFDDPDSSVDCLINQTHDFPTSDEDTDHEGIIPIPSLLNTRRKTPKVNRIYLPGTPASKIKARGFQGRTQMPRESVLECLFEDKAPAMVLSEDELAFVEMKQDAWKATKAKTVVDDDYSMVDGNGDEKNANVDEDDDLVDDPPSMTLKELLLTADMSQYDLMAEAGDDDRLDGSVNDELSFSWE